MAYRKCKIAALLIVGIRTERHKRSDKGQWYCYLLYQRGKDTKNATTNIAILCALCG